MEGNEDIIGLRMWHVGVSARLVWNSPCEGNV